MTTDPDDSNHGVRSLSPDDARLLDAAGFTADDAASDQIAAGATAVQAQLFIDAAAGVAGVDRVLAALPPDLSPVAVVGFLREPHPGLTLNGLQMTPLEWLAIGGDIAPVLGLVDCADWASR